MAINKEELEIYIEVLKELLEKSNVHQKIIIEKMIHKCETLIHTIATGGMGE